MVDRAEFLLRTGHSVEMSMGIFPESDLAWPRHSVKDWGCTVPGTGRVTDGVRSNICNICLYELIFGLTGWIRPRHSFEMSVGIVSRLQSEPATTRREWFFMLHCAVVGQCHRHGIVKYLWYAFQWTNSLSNRPSPYPGQAQCRNVGENSKRQRK